MPFERCPIPSHPRSSSREVRIRVPFFSVVYFSRGTFPPKRNGEKGHQLLGDLESIPGIPERDAGHRWASHLAAGVVPKLRVIRGVLEHCPPEHLCIPPKRFGSVVSRWRFLYKSRHKGGGTFQRLG